MNRKLYLSPAVVSVALHGILFVASKSTALPPTPPTIGGNGPVLILPPAPEMPPLPPEEERPLVADLPAGRLGTPLPGLDELLRDPTFRDFVVDLPPVARATGPVELTHIGPPGIPDGVVNGEGFGPARIGNVIDSRMLDNTPAPRVRTNPNYPSAARADGREGTVMVDFEVNERGDVVRVKVVSSTDPIFEEPARTAVYRWRFTPGLRNGKTVPFRMAIPVVFTLEKA